MKVLRIIISSLNQKNLIILGVCASILISFISLSPTLSNDFFNLDDPDIIIENNIIKSFNLTNFKEILSGFTIGSYHPLTTISFAIEYSIAKLDPRLYHLDNLILHLINIALVYWLIYLLTKSLPTSFIVSLLFGIHPLHVESVVWISERKDVLFSIFYLSSIISYILLIDTESKKIKHYLICLFLFLLSLLSKPAAVTLPIILLLVDYYKKDKIQWVDVHNKIPHFALSFVFGIISIVGARVANAVEANKLYSIFERCFIANFTFITYILKLIYPYKLSILYPYPTKFGGYLNIVFFILPLATIAIITYVIKSLKYTKDYLFGILFYFINIALVLQFFIVGQAFLADRFTYLPSVGIFLIFVKGYLDIKKTLKFSRTTTNILLAIFIAYISFLCFKTYNRTKLWRESSILWTDTITKYPYLTTPYTNRGAVYEIQGKHELALKDFQRALEINPGNETSYNNIGYVLQMLGDYDGALDAYSKSIESDPTYEKAYSNRGTIYMDQGIHDKALSDFNMAIKLNPFKSRSFNNRGLVLRNMGNIKESIENFTYATKINPDFEKAYFNRGVTFEAIGETQLALNDYTKTIEINPDNINAYIKRGLIFVFTSNPDSAIADFSKALILSPNDYTIYNFLGVAYGAKGNIDLALSSYKKAKELNPKFAEPYNNIGIIYANSGKLDLALKEYNDAIRINPEIPETYNNRGLLYAHANNFNLALEDFSKAIALNNNYALAYVNRSQTYASLNDFKSAFADIQTAQKLGLIIDEKYIKLLKDNLQKAL